MTSLRTDRMPRSARLHRRLYDLCLKRAELEAQIKIVDQEYLRSVREEEDARSREVKSDGT